MAADLPDVVATVQDQPISAEALRDSMRGQLLQMDMERYEAMKAQLDALVAERLIALEAAERGMSVEEFERVEIFAKMEPVTPEQVRSFYDANKERLPRSFEELEGRIMVAPAAAVGGPAPRSIGARIAATIPGAYRPGAAPC